MNKNAIILISCLICFTAGKAYSQPKVGQEAPVIKVNKIINSKTLDTKNKFIFLDFWGTWCMPCVRSLPKTDSLAKQFKGEITFLAISNEPEIRVNTFLKNKNWENIVFGLDEDQKLTSDFSIKYYPASYLISPDNKIIAIGNGNPNEFSAIFLDSLIHNYKTSATQNIPKVASLPDISDQIVTIEIKKTTGQPIYLNQINSFAFIIRDTLQGLLPFLSGIEKNKISFKNIPKDTVEVRIFSKKYPLDSLKLIAHDIILKNYTINQKQALQKKDVIMMEVAGEKFLKDKNTFIEEGVLQKQEFINDSINRFDNYSLADLAKYFEKVYYPKLFMVNSSLSQEFDWEFKVGTKSGKSYVWLDIEKLNEIFKKEFHIEFINAEKEILMTDYY